MATMRTNLNYVKTFGYGIQAKLTNDADVLVYKGTAPSDANTYVLNPSAYSGDLLISYTALSLVWNATQALIELYTGTIDVVATGTGTAAWAAIFNPTSPQYCLLCDVGLIGSSAPVTLVGSLSITSGNTVTLADVGVKFTY